MVRSVKSPPRASTSSKRILSNSSLSPLYEGKKTKTFTSPNGYAVFSTVDISDDTVFDAAPSPSRDDTVVHQFYPTDLTDLAPPFYISNITNFSTFNDTLIKTTAPNGFTYMG
ncbi:uncharacterized protein LOC112683422 [Sipha flava]|uniref:Uncharacterized protein LOC112683422 n=1 Tax=Sipha flava TaxID=143950 RepID=A0A8B8FIB2_9HEMI|nr:uncharacterized protein LOC112683422 [Sipha flava]